MFPIMPFTKTEQTVLLLPNKRANRALDKILLNNIFWTNGLN